MTEHKEFKSFYKEVGGNEGNKCHYSTRLDTYGCGCGFNCDYCYARGLLDFRKYWHPENPSVADIEKVKKTIENLPKYMPAIRLGGMTDCFQPIEEKYENTYHAIEALNKKRQPYLIVTKSDLVASDKYIDVMDKNLAHIQITITCFNDDKYKELNYEHAPVPSKRIKAAEKLQEHGFDVAIRLSPLIDEFIDYDRLNHIECDKLLVEFLRLNKKMMDRLRGKIDFSKYTIREHNYLHMPLADKIELLNKIYGFKSITVCEDESTAYEYWKKYYNPNPNDCCNLRKNMLL